MELAGLVPGTQKAYIHAVLACVERCGNIPPERMTEQQVETSIRQRRLAMARGTFQAEFYGLKALFYRTLGRDWNIFTKKSGRSPTISSSRCEIARCVSHAHRRHRASILKRLYHTIWRFAPPVAEKSDLR